MSLIVTNPAAYAGRPPAPSIGVVDANDTLVGSGAVAASATLPGVPNYAWVIEQVSWSFETDPAAAVYLEVSVMAAGDNTTVDYVAKSWAITKSGPGFMPLSRGGVQFPAGRGVRVRIAANAAIPTVNIDGKYLLPQS